MKPKINKQKREGTKVMRNFGIIFVAIALTVVINIVLYVVNNQDVEIAVLPNNAAQDTAIHGKELVKSTMSRKDYKKNGIIEVYEGFSRRSVILWEDRHQIKTAYAAHYIRGGMPLHWDSLTTEPPKDYAYLYEMEGELLKLEVDASHFGSMLVPGDKLNIRITYQENLYNLPTEAEFQKMMEVGAVGSTTVSVGEKLFSETTVLDILNKDGESIFDMYYLLLNYDAQKQREFVNSPEFKEKTEPKELLLSVTPEEAENYLDKMNKSPQLLLTLLPRTSKSTIAEVLKGLGLE